MDQYEFIRTAHRVYGKNISELVRATGHSRNTVKKAIRGEPWGYKEREKQVFPVLGSYLSIIEGWLKQDKEQPKKQRHTARRIYNRLQSEHDYQGSESNVRRYVRMARLNLGLDLSCQVFIPCEPDADQEAEVDWGSAAAVLAGETVRLKFFCMRSKYSGKHFVRFYPCERQQALFDAHIKGFEFFGGIFPVLIYDNLTTAVRKVLQGKKRLEQEGFRKFKAYHNFTSRFCNPDSGNEKILRQCMAYGSHKMAGRSQSVAELYEEEKIHLLEQPEAIYSNIQPHEARAGKYATVTVDKNRYSVPWRYAGRKLKILLHVERVEIFFGGKKLAVHERLFGNNKWSLAPDHYLELIQKRPMSFNSARPIRQWREQWPESLHRLLASFCRCQGETKGIKDFISVLMLYSRYQPGEIEAAVELALEKNLSTSEGVQHLLIYANEAGNIIAPLSSWPSLPSPDVAVYGVLGGVQ
ncbi:MAG: IS21 family transposase [Pseudomonadota bacterium]